MATSSWTIRYIIVTLDRSLRSSRDSQPRYSRIDDALPLTTVRGGADIGTG